MSQSIQEQIKTAQEVIKGSPTLEQLFETIPDIVKANGTTYTLHIEPTKGGITYVGFLDVMNHKGKPLIHIESISGIHDAMVRAIEELAGNVSDEWE